MSSSQNRNLRYTAGLISAACLAIGSIGFFWTFEDGCSDIQSNYELVARNIIIVSLLFLSVNFLRNSWEKLEKLGLISWILCRYLLIFLLVPGAVNKVLNMHYNFSYAAANGRIMDLDPQALMWQAYSSSDTYEMLIGIGQIIIILLLTFRRTTPVAVMLILPIIINNFAFAYIFDSCTLLSYSRSIFLTIGIIAYLAPDLYYWVKSIEFKKLLGFEKTRLLHAREVINITKIILIIGLMTQQFWKIDRSRKYYQMSKQHPIVGIWTVQSIKASTADFPKFSRLIFEQSVFGNVEVEDSLSTFYYVVDTTYRQMEFYNFHEFRSLDIKGKYEMIDSSTVKYVGRNNKDSLEFIMKKQKFKSTKMNE